jgi:hypothetical protein
MDSNSLEETHLDLITDEHFIGGEGSGQEGHPSTTSQTMAEQERLKRLTPEQIKKEEKEKRLKLEQEKEKREKDSKIIEKLIEDFERNRPEKAKIGSTKEKLYEVMYEIILKAKNENIDIGEIENDMF